MTVSVLFLFLTAQPWVVLQCLIDAVSGHICLLSQNNKGQCITGIFHINLGLMILILL